MTESQISQKLNEFGVHPQAAKVYLSVTKGLQRSANEIAKDTGLPRSTVYLQTQNLVNQGLLTPVLQNKTQYYTATSPQTLLSIATEKLSVAESLVPSLRELAKASKVSKPQSVVFVGKKAVEGSLNELLVHAREKRATIFSITNNDSIFSSFPRFFPKWIRKREEMKIDTQLIAVASAQNHPAFKETRFKKVRFLPKGFKYKGAIKITENRLLFLSLDPKNMYSVQIDSEIMSLMFRSLFMFMWESARE